ncbi:MAG: exodeoxyribonuclease VII large subunit [Bryobacteraceae bacterium]|nr:exodeoxyribonuclease VII large subunit [Bryobacteraceae bacterium]
MGQLSIDWGPQRQIYSVSELSAAVRDRLEGDFSDIWVAGEISGCKIASSGHCYFTIKDRDTQLSCVCFRSDLRYLRFKPQDGAAVNARGRLDLYPKRVDLQFIVQAIEPQGHGALQVAFEQLKRKLAAEGLFDAARKRPLPRFPRRIGIVTSPAGAAIHDMIQILSRRFPGIHVRLYPAQVQGEGSVESVCRGLEYFAKSQWADVIIVGRGGGSLEDLWTFNEEAVARAIAASPIPVISAVGHETDFTIADFVADHRSPTPSAAAEQVICTRQEVLDRILSLQQRIERGIHLRIAQLARRLHQQAIDRPTAILHRRIGRSLQRVDELDYTLRSRIREILARAHRRHAEADARLRQLDLRLRLAKARQRLDAAEQQIVQLGRFRLLKAQRLLEPLLAQLEQLSPLRVLERGYAIVENETGVVRDASAAPVGSEIRVRLARGKLGARVTDQLS